MNIFASLRVESANEMTDVLARGQHVRIERIVSHGQASPPGFWYDQNWDEWVVVLKGRAKLRFEAKAGDVEMGQGDWMNIPAHARHRVEWTDPDQQTVWLAVHYMVEEDPVRLLRELRGIARGIDTTVPREQDREL